MNHDTYKKKVLRKSKKILFIPLSLLFCSQVFPQIIQEKDIHPKTLNSIKIPDTDSIRLFYIRPSSLLLSKLFSLEYIEKERIDVLLGSLKNKASKTLVTRELYDLIVTSQKPSDTKSLTDQSDKNYLDYSGKKIRNITIRRLNVFGSDLNNPNLYNPGRADELLNKTHFNTNEIIIRKNLLFHEDDTVSPLTLSDNERLLRQLPFIDDARIVVVPVSDSEADIVVLTKDVYSLGGILNFDGIQKGTVSLFEKNIFGMGHEFRIEVPYDSQYSDSPALGVGYKINNIGKSFVNLDIYYYNGLGKKTYGFDLTRDLVSSETKYAGGISVRQMFTSEDLDSLKSPSPLKYNLQDYWISRSFMLNKESVTRFIAGVRYTNNNVFDHPFILPDSYHYLQKYKMILGSASLSIQEYYKANLIYGYGRTEDIPFGGLMNITIGKEFNEYKERLYVGTSISLGHSIKQLGYFYNSLKFATFLNKGTAEQGIVSISSNIVSNLVYIGKSRIRNFINLDYTRGFARYSDESLNINRELGFSGFRNDSIGGNQRVLVNLESVIFSPVYFYGFRFAFFGFADMAFIFDSNQNLNNGDYISSLGFGIRIRNDNLVLNTFQIRLGIYPNLPHDSRINYIMFSGEQLLRPNNFEPGAPSVLTYH